MKSILPTCDVNLIKGILSRENIYTSLVYDNSPSLQEYAPKGIWLLLLEGEAICGFINLEQLNNIMWQPHIFIFEQYRGNNSEEWGKQAIQFMKEKIEAKKLLAFTPYKEAKKYAEKIGMKNIGILQNSILKNGQLLNQYILELSC